MGSTYRPTDLLRCSEEKPWPQAYIYKESYVSKLPLLIVA
jgi:hypothetical protein